MLSVKNPNSLVLIEAMDDSLIKHKIIKIHQDVLMLEIHFFTQAEIYIENDGNDCGYSGKNGILLQSLDTRRHIIPKKYCF